MVLEISVDTRDARRMVKVLEFIPKDMKRGISLALRESAKEIARDTRSLLRRKRAGRRGEASRPGEPPALRTGALARSIGFRRGRRDGLSYVVEAREFYARFLEVGDEPRPFISLAFDRKRTVIENRIVEAITRTLEEAARA